MQQKGVAMIINNRMKVDGFDFSPEINLVRYLQKIKKFPILTPEEEYYLACEYKKTKDPALSYKLLTSHLRLVVKIVAKYKGYGLPLAEMIAEGNIGLLQALDKFEPDKGNRFSTYAMWWIKASVQKYILNSWSLVKIGTTSAQKKLFFNLKKVKDKLNLMHDNQMSDEIIDNIASHLDVSRKDVIDMNERMRAHDGSLNEPMNADDTHNHEWMDFISDAKPNQEEVFAQAESFIKRKKIFAASLVCLNPREKDILFKRRLEIRPVTLEALSALYHISKERVRQIELNSIKKMQKFVAEHQF